MSLLGGQDTTLTDLFRFLSDLERDQTIVDALKDYSPEGVSKLNNILDQYQLPPPIRQILGAYQQNRAAVSYPPTQKDPDEAYREHYRQVADLLRPIKEACAGEIDRIWEELGVC